MKKCFLLLMMACMHQIGTSQILTDSSALQAFVFRDVMHISVPEMVLPIWDEMQKLEREQLTRALGMLTLEDPDDKVMLKFRWREREVKPSSDLAITDRLSRTIYRGTVHWKKIIDKEGREYAIHCMTGQWNLDPRKMVMLRISTNYHGEYYSVLLKYPAEWLDASQNLLQEIIDSIYFLDDKNTPR